MNIMGYALGGAVVAISASPLPLYAASSYEKLRDKLVAIEIVGRDNNGRDVSSFGTGFLVHEGGYVLTAAHLYEDLIKNGAIEATLKTTAHVADFTSAAIGAELVDRNKHDIAVLKLAKKVGGYPAARLMCNVNFGVNFSRVDSSGFYYFCSAYDPVAKTCLQGRLKYSQTTGEVATVDDSALADTYDVNLNFSYGNSGSPVYLPNGLVVAIAKGNIESASNKAVIVPITWAEPLLRSIPGIPPCVDITPCINARVALANSEKFSQAGGVRAGGSGPNLKAVSEETDVCYSTPPDYEIEGQVAVKDDGNNGGRGSIGPVDYRKDADGRAVGACVKVKAWGDDKLFGAGGWQYVTLTGLIRKKATTAKQLSSARDTCLNESIE
ncbi:S1 family peptidase [Bradyrhizobium paxllaeri]|uniref:S1 family peptidase n=1 Tax=Bradyrhizobium paxllaeri TaxID=190148 RepID=UPI0016527F9A|nr:serine protease [Bradyrhizobium paxllaeri]